MLYRGKRSSAAFFLSTGLATTLLAGCGSRPDKNLAIANLRAIISAQITYSATCGQGGYATTLEDLARPTRADGITFIGSNLGTNGIIRGGYKLTVAKDAAAGVSDVGTAAETCNGSVRAPASSFFVSAEPVTPGRAPYLAADARGIIFYGAKPISNPIVESAAVERLR